MSNFLRMSQVGQDREILVNLDNVLFITSSPNHDGAEIWFGFPIKQLIQYTGKDNEEREEVAIKTVAQGDYTPCLEVEENVFTLEMGIAARRKQCK